MYSLPAFVLYIHIFMYIIYSTTSCTQIAFLMICWEILVKKYGHYIGMEVTHGFIFGSLLATVTAPGGVTLLHIKMSSS